MQQHAPGARPEKAGKDVEQRRFSATRSAEDADEFALVNREREVADCEESLPATDGEGLGYPIGAQD